jgi:hypothetical protein
MKRWIGITFLIIGIILVLLFVFGLYYGRHNSTDVANGGAADKQLTVYKEYMQRTEAQSKDYLKKGEAILDKNTQVIERMNRSQDRFEQLLKRWENQADRYDALLKKWETGK